MSDVIPLRKCGRCGGPGSPLSIDVDGATVARAFSCTRCTDEVSDFLDAERPIFEALIAAGVDRACANAMMIERHRHMRSAR